MAAIPDNFEINVAKDGRHYCKIELPVAFKEQAMDKLAELRSIFGDEYHLSMTKWICYGVTEDEWK